MDAGTICLIVRGFKEEREAQCIGLGLEEPGQIEDQLFRLNDTRAGGNQERLRTADEDIPGPNDSG